MIISHKYKFIWFFPIGHTASTSLFLSLRHLYDDTDYRVGTGFVGGTPTSDSEDCGLHTASRVLHKHITPIELLDNGFDKKKFDEYRKIAVCRNPYTWMAAMSRKNMSIETYSAPLLSKFWRSRWITETNHAHGQYALLTHVDKIIHFEKLESEWEVFKTEFGINPWLPLRRIVKPHEHNRIDYIENYTRGGFQFVNEVCAQDFELLEYTKRSEDDILL